MSEGAEAPRQRSVCLGLFKSQSEPAKLLEPKPEGSSAFGMGEVGELRAREGLWTAFRCGVFEESLLGRSGILFIYIHLITLRDNKPARGELTQRFIKMSYFYPQESRKNKPEKERLRGPRTQVIFL